MANAVIPLDCLVFGGGVAGLFILDRCLSNGLRCVLLESNSLGTGQTIDSQGILHGGLKYAITSSGSNSAKAIREMPLVWRRLLAGESTPDLTNVVMRAEYCHVWRTDTIRSKLGWLAAKFALQTKPQPIDPNDLPNCFQGMDGPIARLDEQVIEPRSLLEVLSHKLDRHLLQTVEGGVEVSRLDDGWLVQLLNPESGEPQDLFAKKIILAAGKGNRQLRESFGLKTGQTQERPLHMLMARGDLPVINGHCIDGAKTRVTITTTQDYAGRAVWQIGGQLSEDGVKLSPEDLISHGVNELRAVLPQVNFDLAEFRTYKSTRAESNAKGNRPAEITILEEKDVFTCWPTKLVFAPRLADEVTSRIGQSIYEESNEMTIFSSWPSPTVALPPWETDHAWTSIGMTCTK